MCPYLGDNYCDISARRLHPGKISGCCETDSYTQCSSYTSDGDNENEYDDNNDD
ncbi:MAG: hypothetical protein LBL34_07190 [Clostridiales bacterium]|jgi:hypothetical protein|nr:hypothetical protein [Clostridiales bacterium]